MAERLTKCIDSHLLDNGEMVKEYSLNSKIKLNHFSCMDIPNAVYDKLGKLEDILEKYDIESVEELDCALENKIEDISNPFLQGYVRAFFKDRLQYVETEMDTWKRACELAVGYICLPQYRNINLSNKFETVKSVENYFYQQAKKKKENE